MSNYANGEWESIWDGLFWSFVMKHKDFFSANPRTSMLAHSLNRMSEDKRNSHIKNADSFIQNKLNAL
jgi:deoxyribodipyrimidine photolyase-related protein